MAGGAKGSAPTVGAAADAISEWVHTHRYAGRVMQLSISLPSDLADKLRHLAHRQQAQPAELLSIMVCRYIVAEWRIAQTAPRI